MKNKEYEQYLLLIEVLNEKNIEPILPESKERLERIKEQFLKEI